MHMHPTTTHLAADYRRQDYLTEAAISWNSRPEADRLQVRRRMPLLWHMGTALDGVLTWLTREFTPTPPTDQEMYPGRPLSIYGPR